MESFDDLQDFIADTEWKTRKILRESNKRMKDSARLLAAKERVELLKQNGGKGAVIKPPKTPEKFVSNVVKSASIPHPNNASKEWKERDKIIHDACETIKSLDKTASKRIREIKTDGNLSASLSASPFHDWTKGNRAAPSSSAKSKTKKSKGSRKNNGEAAVVSRRTIERDFYIMSKKRSQPKRRQKASANGEAQPELKSSVLWKKYRCTDRIMESKSREAAKLYEKFERLPSFNGDSSNYATDNPDDDSSSSSSEEEKAPTHALHEMLDAHVTEENHRSQRRVDKMLSQITFKPNVQVMWDQLEQGRDDKLAPHAKTYTQVQSVPNEAATKRSYQPKSLEGGETTTAGPVMDRLDKRKVVPYASPYKQPPIILNLIYNESLMLHSRKSPLHVSISYEFKKITQDASNEGSWVYDIYDPDNGTSQYYKLTCNEFDRFVSRCKAQPIHVVETVVIKKIVHQQKDGSNLYVVVVSNDGLNIWATIHRSLSHSKEETCTEIASLGVHFKSVCSLRACEVLHLLGKHQIHSVFNEEFWMSSDNGNVIWISLIDLVCHNSQSPPKDDSLLRSVSAFESLVALKHVAEKDHGLMDIERIFSSVQEGLTESSNDMEKCNECVPLLSMRISHHSPYSDTLCPGHTGVGIRGIWRLRQPIPEEKSNTSFPNWLTDAKYPSQLDITQASAHIYYKSLGPQKGVSVTTLSRLAFESPVFSPPCHVTDRRYIVPPFAQPKIVDGVVPTVKIPCKSLLENPVKSRYDTLLPPTVLILDPAATKDDWSDAPRDARGNVFHVRDKDEFDDDGFRIKAFAHKIVYDDTVKSRVYGISEKAATPNSLAATPFLIDKSVDCCTEYLSRKRTAEDYHYIAENDGEGTNNVPYLFTTHMKAYKSIYVSRKSITCYFDEEQFLLATKQAEAKKAEIALKIQAAEEIAEARWKERMEKIHQSMDLTTKSNDGIDLPSAMPRADACDPSLDEEYSEVKEQILPHSNQAAPDEVDELDQMANMLLNNTNFLRAIARKLNLSEDRVTQNQAQPALEPIEPATISESSSKDGQKNPTNSKHESTIQQIPVVPKLDLRCKTYQGSIVLGQRGDGWKRLPRTDTLVGEFKLTNRKVEKNTAGEKFGGFEGRRNFFAANAVEEIRYEADPKIYGVKTTTMFISDLVTERLRLSKSQRQQKQYEKSLLNADQQFSLQEILQIPVSGNNPSGRKAGENVDNVAIEDKVVPDYDMMEHSNQPSDSVDPITRAILAVKNHNLQHLEHILDTEGVSIETRDPHGNTLFILACQQGSKRLAKFLLRRGADINAQNNGGNTALHYLHEYHHKQLAEYLLRKGASDTLLNAEGFTVYEGLHRDDEDDE